MALEADAQRLTGDLQRTRRRRLECKDTLLRRERKHPLAGRELCEYLVDVVRARYLAATDWSAPQYPPEQGGRRNQADASGA